LYIRRRRVAWRQISSAREPNDSQCPRSGQPLIDVEDEHKNADETAVRLHARDIANLTSLGLPFLWSMVVSITIDSPARPLKISGSLA
jgi:hypothetical protein